MKYVMFDCPLGGAVVKIPVIFPNNLVHADVAKAFLQCLPPGSKPSTAGEVSLLAEDTHGKSTTLGLPSSPQDKLVINMGQYGFGVQYDPEPEPAPVAQIKKPLPGWSR